MNCIKPEQNAIIRAHTTNMCSHYYTTLSFVSGRLHTEFTQKRGEDWLMYILYIPLEGLLLLRVLLHTPQKLKVASNPTHGRGFTNIVYSCYRTYDWSNIILKALGHHLMISCSCMCVCHAMKLKQAKDASDTSFNHHLEFNNVCSLVNSLRH